MSATDQLIHLARSVWLDGRLYLANHVVSRIPSHTLRRWLYKRLFGFAIGNGSTIFLGAWLDNPAGRLRIGANSVINQNCRLDNRAGITIGDHVSISAEVCILTADHDVNDPAFSGRLRPVVIEDYVFVGTRAIILPGVTLRHGSAVAAGAVVTRDVEPFTIVAGIPARAVAVRNPQLTYNPSYLRLFW